MKNLRIHDKIPVVGLVAKTTKTSYTKFKAGKIPATKALGLRTFAGGAFTAGVFIGIPKFTHAFSDYA